MFNCLTSGQKGYSWNCLTNNSKTPKLLTNADNNTKKFVYSFFYSIRNDSSFFKALWVSPQMHQANISHPWTIHSCNLEQLLVLRLYESVGECTSPLVQHLPRVAYPCLQSRTTLHHHVKQPASVRSRVCRRKAILALLDQLIRFGQRESLTIHASSGSGRMSEESSAQPVDMLQSVAARWRCTKWFGKWKFPGSHPSNYLWSQTTLNINDYMTLFHFIQGHIV